MAEQAKDKCIYSIDSSSWISIEGDPAQNRILAALAELAAQGRLKSTKHVFWEVKKTSGVTNWLSQHDDLIRQTPTDIDYLLKVGEITHQFQAMQGARGSRERADAWVVGLACYNRANPTEWRVVADETDAKRPNRKIPAACDAFNVKCLTLKEMLKLEFPDDEW